MEALKNWKEKFKHAVRGLKQNLAALYLAYRRKDTPVAAKIAALAAVGYALSPIDLIPDFIPVLGYLDDFIILPLLIALAIRLIPGAILSECRAQAADLWAGGKPKSWKYAVPIFVVWLAILALVLKAILSHIQ